MKIAVISPNPRHLQQASSVLGAFHDVLTYEGGKTRMGAVADEQRPDVLIADGMCCDPAELAHVEDVTTRHPHTAVMLMCALPTPEFLLQSMRAGVREVLPSPVTEDALLAAVSRIAAKRGLADADGRGRIVAFLGCKGGSGATFCAVNVAFALARRHTVLLLDLHLQFGDALALVHDGRAPSTLASLASQIDRLDGSLLAASTVKVAPGLGVLAAPEDPAHAVDIRAEHVDAILNTATAHYDFVVVDLPRALDPVSIHVFDQAERIHPVLVPSLPAIHHARKLAEAFHALGYADTKVRPVLNRWDRGGDIGVDQVQKALRARDVIVIPEATREVAASIDHGEPLVHSHPGHAVARRLADIAAELDPASREAPRGLLGRLLRRA